MKKPYILILGLSLILIAILDVEAVPEPNAKVRAIQLGNSLSTDPGTEGILGVDIDCVGGIGYNANDFHCFLVPEGVAPGQYDWDEIVKGNDPVPVGVILLDTTTSIPCPSGVGFNANDKCFSITFNGSNFDQEAEWHFIGVFTENGDVVGIAGQDWRVHSFMVLPEAAIGAVAVFGSIFVAFIGYNYMRRKSSI